MYYYSKHMEVPLWTYRSAMLCPVSRHWALWSQVVTRLTWLRAATCGWKMVTKFLTVI